METPWEFRADKLLTQQDIEKILNDEETEAITIAEEVDPDSDVIKRFFRVWCHRVDKIQKIDKMLHGDSSTSTNLIINWRGFTYKEYGMLFNASLPPEKFFEHPVYHQLNRSDNRRKGGIKTVVQRDNFTLEYSYNEDDYVKLLAASGFTPLIRFFLRGRLPYRIPLKYMLMHTYVVAPTGAGKSELLRYMFYQLQKKYPTFSLVLIDPHGDLSKKLKRLYLNKNPERLVYIDPYLKNGYTPTFNVFDIGSKTARDVNNAVEQIIVAFEDVLTRSGGELSESMVNMLEKCLTFLLKREGSTLIELKELLSLGEIQQEAALENPYFREEFLKDNVDKRTRKALLTRVERLLNPDVTKNLLGGQSTFNLEHAMNSGKVVLFNLSGLGELSQTMFGKFLIANIKSLIRKRTTVNPRRTFLFIDECQNLVSGSYEYMLSQLRKYGLHLVLANQFAAQLGDQLESVKQNTAVKIVGGDEPENLSKVFKLPEGERLKEFEFYSKVRGKKVKKFSSPSSLINNKKKQLTSEQEEELDNYLLEHYYKVIGEPTPKRSRKESEETLESKEQKDTTTTPPFDLYLGDADTPTE